VDWVMMDRQWAAMRWFGEAAGVTPRPWAGGVGGAIGVGGEGGDRAKVDGRSD
jgi:hypothetical protein